MATAPELMVQLVEGELCRVEARPGDTLVVMTEERLAVAHRAILTRMVEDHFPGCRVLVLDEGKRLAVVGRGEADDATTRYATPNEVRAAHGLPALPHTDVSATDQNG